jgi:hypothetical protein
MNKEVASAPKKNENISINLSSRTPTLHLSENVDIDLYW